MYDPLNNSISENMKVKYPLTLSSPSSPILPPKNTKELLMEYDENDRYSPVNRSFRLSGPQTFHIKSHFTKKDPTPFGTFGCSKRFTLTEDMKIACQIDNSCILLFINRSITI